MAWVNWVLLVQYPKCQLGCSLIWKLNWRESTSKLTYMLIDRPQVLCGYSLWTLLFAIWASPWGCTYIEVCLSKNEKFRRVAGGVFGMKKGFFHRWKRNFGALASYLVWVLTKAGFESRTWVQLVYLGNNPRRPNEHLGKKCVNEQVPTLGNCGVILLGISERM